MSFNSGMWWGMLLLILVVSVPTGWIFYWVIMFIGGLLKDIFGDRFMKSWLSNTYRKTRRQKPKDVWMMIAGGAIFGVIYLIALTYLIDLY